VREGPWRRPGLLEASLASNTLTGEMIADGKHLPPTLMALAWKAFGPDRLCIVSDATSGAGLPEGSAFTLGALTYEVHDGVGMMPDRSAFAGSSTLLDGMLAVVVRQLGVPLFEAVRAASLTPARVIGVDRTKGSIAAGKDADLAVFAPDLTPLETLIAGRTVARGLEGAPS
jgi:N-acetylglucosamine-6-phosphate deacetylase